MSTVAVPANLLADPAVAPATVLGVVAALLSLLWPWGAGAVATVAGTATGWIAFVAHRAADVPGAELPWWPGPGGALALLVLTGGVVALTLSPAARGVAVRARLRRQAPADVPGRNGRPIRPAPGRPVRRSMRASVLAAGAVAVLVGWVLGPRLPAPGSAGVVDEWSVAMCDVGQGDATALRSGPDRAVLVDVGPDPSAVDRCLHRLGIRHLDLVLLTHGHADHVLGLPGALRGRTASRLMISPLHEPRANVDQVLAWATRASVPVEVAVKGAAGRSAGAGHAVGWRLLSAGAGEAAGRGPTGAGEPEGSTVNESSVTLVADVSSARGSLRLVALGDLETAGQAALLYEQGSSDSLDGVDVVKVAHHGSAKQVDSLYRRLGAPVALIGVGAGNDYGHPTASALSMLQREGATVFRTDRDGDVLLVPGSGEGVDAWTGGS